jgi:hypothetical protein
MRTITLVRSIALLAVIVVLASCGQKETPEERVQRLRSRHEIYPVGTTTIHDADGQPTLLIDFQVANQGTEPLSVLTVLVRVRGHDGGEKLAQRVSLDLKDVRPGIGERRTATVAGFELADDDEVYLELEANLSFDELRTLPEYGEVAGVS